MKTKTLDFLNGNIFKNMMKLAMPIIIGMLIQTAFNIVDTIFVGRLGPDALAAMAMSFPVVFFVMAIAAGTGVGVNSLISRYLGAKRKKEADNVAEHGFLLVFVWYIFFLILGLSISKSLFKFLGANEVILPMILEYISVFFYGNIVLFLTFIANNILRAEGDSKTPMKVMMIAGLINIILDPIFIFGFGIIPVLGIKGAAIATVIARIFASIFVINHILVKRKSHLELKLNDFKFKWSIIRKIYRVGFPSALSQIVISLGIFVFNGLVISFGTQALAAFGILFRLESIMFMPLMGLMTAIITIAGHNYGAKKYARIHELVFEGIKVSTVFTIVLSIFFISFPEFLMRIFIQDLEVISIGVNFLKIVPIGYIFIPSAMMILGAFQGIGYGIFTVFYHVTRLFILTLPIAYFLAFVLNLGLIGISWAFVISSLMMGIIAILWYKFGYWRKKYNIDSR